MINCMICGKKIQKTGPTQVTCKERCFPEDGLLIECCMCGEKKDYWSFRDYRGTAYEKGFIRRCKQCDCSYQLSKYYERKGLTDEKS